MAQKHALTSLSAGKPQPPRAGSPPKLVFPSTLTAGRHNVSPGRSRDRSADLDARITKMGSRRWRRFVNDQFLDSPVPMGSARDALAKENLAEELPFYRRGVRFSLLTPADFGDEPPATGEEEVPPELLRLSSIGLSELGEEEWERVTHADAQEV